MKKWTNFFDAIYLINLDECIDRLKVSLKQLHFFGIPVQVFEATYNENGIIGLRDTMIRLFQESLEQGYENILVFEDDIFLLTNINLYMPLCLEQLPKNYDSLHLGGYVIRPFLKKHSENLLLLDKILTTHAVCYPKKTMEFLLKLFITHSENPRDKTPIDMDILNRVLINGNSFITYPLLVSQTNGYSYIEKKEINYELYIEKEYASNYEKLNKLT